MEVVDLSEAEDNVVIGVVTVSRCRRPATTIFSNGIQGWGSESMSPDEGHGKRHAMLAHTHTIGYLQLKGRKIAGRDHTRMPQRIGKV